MSASFLFLATEGFPPTVIDAQVGDLLAVLARHGLRFDALVFDPLLPRTLATADGRARMKRLRDAVPGALVTRPYVPFEDRVGAPLARRLLLRQLRRRGPTVVHARGLWAAWLACAARRAGAPVRVIYDCRGDVEAEHAFHVAGQGAPAPGGAGALRAAPGLRRIRRAEGAVLAEADRVLAVSSALRDVLERRRPGVATRADVVPCGHDPGKFRLDALARATWRARLGLDERRWVLAYAGSLVPYQLPDALVRAGQLARAARPDAHLLLITPEVDRARALLAAAGLGPDAATALAAKHGDVPGLLAAADAALLLRRRDPVNAVASPTKLAEYLACGLAVLVSDGIGDASALVRSRDLGVVLDDVDDPAALERAVRALAALPARREAIAAVAREELARDRFVDVYLRLYRSLAGA